MKVKICGITRPEEAEYAARSGADFIGINFSPRSRRVVSIPLAIKIASACKEGGAEPVGIFVDETADQLISICEQVGLTSVQLHGETARKSLAYILKRFSIFYAISVEKSGNCLKNEEFSPEITPLYDYLKGGSGESFDWRVFSPPKNSSWMLAGGLNPGNVAEAIALLRPYGVDVASGVEYPGSVRKDPVLIKTFIKIAKESDEAL